MTNFKKIIFLNTVFLSLAFCSSPEHQTQDWAQHSDAVLEPLHTSSRSPANTTDDLSTFESKYATNNFFDHRDSVLSQQGARAVVAHNTQLMRLLGSVKPSPKAIKAKADGKSWKPSLQMQQAEALYRWLETHPVASTANIKKYDPKENIGFCFGRATAVHLKALHPEYRLHPSSIRKIWVVGPMHGGWGHHVATMTLVSNSNGSSDFVVIDPETGVVSANQWIAKMKTYEKDPRQPLMFFVSHPSRFSPYPGKYTRIDLWGPDRGDRNTDAYRNYFHDLVNKFRLDRIKKQSKVKLDELFQKEYEAVSQTNATLNIDESQLADDAE